MAAIALNTRALDEDDARAAIAAAEAETGLPADDVVRFGADRLADAVLEAVRQSVLEPRAGGASPRGAGQADRRGG